MKSEQSVKMWNITHALQSCDITFYYSYSIQTNGTRMCSLVSETLICMDNIGKVKAIIC